MRTWGDERPRVSEEVYIGLRYFQYGLGAGVVFWLLVVLVVVNIANQAHHQTTPETPEVPEIIYQVEV